MEYIYRRRPGSLRPGIAPAPGGSPSDAGDRPAARRLRPGAARGAGHLAGRDGEVGLQEAAGEVEADRLARLQVHDDRSGIPAEGGGVVLQRRGVGSHDLARGQALDVEDVPEDLRGYRARGCGCRRPGSRRRPPDVGSPGLGPRAAPGCPSWPRRTGPAGRGGRRPCRDRIRLDVQDLGQREFVDRVDAELHAEIDRGRHQAVRQGWRNVQPPPGAPGEDLGDVAIRHDDVIRDEPTVPTQSKVGWSRTLTRPIGGCSPPAATGPSRAEVLFCTNRTGRPTRMTTDSSSPRPGVPPRTRGSRRPSATPMGRC